MEAAAGQQTSFLAGANTVYVRNDAARCTFLVFFDRSFLSKRSYNSNVLKIMRGPWKLVLQGLRVLESVCMRLPNPACASREHQAASAAASRAKLQVAKEQAALASGAG